MALVQDRPGYRIHFHPRSRSKPLSCQQGHHKGKLKTILDSNGMPMLVCPKCGGGIYQGLHDGTLTRKEINSSPETRKPRTQRELMEQSWAKLEQLRRERRDASIKKFVRERLTSEGH